MKKLIIFLASVALLTTGLFWVTKTSSEETVLFLRIAESGVMMNHTSSGTEGVTYPVGTVFRGNWGTTLNYLTNPDFVATDLSTDGGNTFNPYTWQAGDKFHYVQIIH